MENGSPSQSQSSAKQVTAPRPLQGDPLETVDQMVERGAASQREFITPACVLVLTYIFAWPAAIVGHWLLLVEAKRVAAITGKNPPGRGCLQFLFLMLLMPVITVVLLVMLLTGAFATAAAAASSQASGARPRPSIAVPVQAPPLVEETPTELPSFDFDQMIAAHSDDVTPEATPVRESLVRNAVITTDALEVFNKGPQNSDRTKVELKAPVGLYVLREVDEGGTVWLDCLVSRWQGDSFSGWVSAEDLDNAGFERTTQLDMRKLLPAPPAQ